MCGMSADLLTPVLTEEDDALGFDRPWNPWFLLLIAFVFGIVPGGVLLALNFRRLGRPRGTVPALAVVVAAALMDSAAWAIVDRFVDPEGSAFGYLGFGALVAPRLVALAIARRQRRRFRLCRACGVETGGLRLGAGAVIVLGIAAEIGILNII